MIISKILHKEKNESFQNFDPLLYTHHEYTTPDLVSAKLNCGPQYTLTTS